MDPFTQKLLEKTRQRREQLQQKLQSTPTAAVRKRKPLQIDTTPNTKDTPLPSDSGHDSEYSERRRMSACTTSSDEPSPKPDTRTGRLAKLAQQINNWEDDLSHHVIPKEEPVKKVWQPPRLAEVPPKEESKPPKPPRAFQASGVATPQQKSAGAAAIQQKSSPKEGTRRSPRTLVDAASKTPAAGAARLMSSSSHPVKAPTSITQLATPSAQQPTKTSSQNNVRKVDAFTFGAKHGAPEHQNGSVPAAATTKHIEEDSAPVADRCALWEKKTGDALAPMRDAQPLGSAQKENIMLKACSGSPASQQSQTTEFRPSRPERRRSRSANPSTLPALESPSQKGNAPWDSQKKQQAVQRSTSQAPANPTPVASQAPAASQEPLTTRSAGDDQWNQSAKRDECTFEKAPMSARKNAWEAKIAEQHHVAEEHHRIMYRTRSATRFEAGSPSARSSGSHLEPAGTTSGTTQKQAAVSQLRQGQQHVYDPAQRAKMEREAELRALQNRFNNKGLLSNEAPASQKEAQKVPTATSTESLEDQEYYTATETENTEESCEEEWQRSGRMGFTKRQVSFAASAAAHRSNSMKSDSDREQRLSRRSSAKIPSLGYDSTSEDDSEPLTPVPKLFTKTPTRDRPSPSKIPRMGDESSADSLDDLSNGRQTSSSSLDSSGSSASYRLNDTHASNGGAEIDDLLDEALDEPSPEPRRKVTPRRQPPEISKPENRESGESPPTALYSIDAYRQRTKSMAVLAPTATPRNPVSKVYLDDHESDTSSMCSTVSEQDRRTRIRELQECVQQEQNVIVQTSNALNQCCMSGSNFNGSSEQVECNRLLLIACQRRQAYLSEIERLKTGSAAPRKGKGSVTIKDIQLPLKHDFVQKIGSPEDTTVHYFLLMVRNGAQVIVTQMVSTHDALVRGVLQFPNLIKLNDIMNNFKYELEVYGMQVCREPTGKTPSKKEKKKVMSRNKSITAGGQTASGSHTIRTTNFTHITSLTLTMASVQQTAFQLPRVPYLSPLQGTIHLSMQCIMEANVVHRGFVNMFEDVAGFGAWHRRWCVLSENKLAYWKYPDDEKLKEPMGLLNLKDCVTPQIGLVSRDKCARQNTIEITIVRPASKADTSGMNRQIRDRMLHEQHWLAMDTKEDRLEWCSKMNESLSNTRQWYSDAAQPLPSKRIDI